MTTGVKIEISDDAVKIVMVGAVLIGMAYIIYKIIENIPDDEIPLPKEARDFSKLPEVTPSTIDEVNFHPRIKERVEPLLRDGHFVSAIREAAVGLYDVIREKSGLNEDCTTLITKAFRGSNPVLKFRDVAPPHITKAEDGLIGYLESFSKHTRKILMHATVEVLQEEALLKVNLACYLAEQVEMHTVKNDQSQSHEPVANC